MSKFNFCLLHQRKVCAELIQHIDFVMHFEPKYVATLHYNLSCLCICHGLYPQGGGGGGYSENFIYT